MRKSLLILLFSVFVLANVYSLPEFKLSAGTGLYAAGDFGGGYASKYIYGEYQGVTMDYFKTPYFGGGAFVFFDMTYIETSLGFFAAEGKWIYYDFDHNGISDFSVFLTGLDIGLLLKYPFVIKKRFSIFPLAGINYRAVLASSASSAYWTLDNKSGDFNALWFKFGAGFDISLTDRIYFRGNVLYGFRLENEFEVKGDGSNPPYSLPGHGFDVKLAVGFRL